MKPYLKILSSLLSVVLLVSLFPTYLQTARAKTLMPRSVPLKPAHSVIQAGESHEVIEVKFVEGSSFSLQNGHLTAQGNDNLRAVQTVLQDHQAQSVERLFSQSEADMRAEKMQIEAASGEQMPDLNLWYRVTVPPGTDAEAFIDALNALPEVEIAYAAPLPAPPPGFVQKTVQPGTLLSTPSYVSSQGYLTVAPNGINAKYAWKTPGGNGINVAFVDIEYSFNKKHEDIKGVTLIGGAMYNGYGNDHGTAVQGELVGKRNIFGITGIAYRAVSMVSSPCSDTYCSTYNVADAINVARLNTTPGDVILIEQQGPVCGLPDYGPVEWYQSVYDAIKVSTASMRIVVEAAGNGSVNLDRASCQNRFKRSVRDSRAIIVGAGSANGGRVRLYFSTYGSRVDVQGWGESVVTAGYGDLQGGVKTGWYTALFNGTSSASPIVAGAAGLLSSIAQQRGKLLSPAQIRAMLVSSGSPQQSTLGKKIGPLPNLKAAIAKIP